MGISDFWARNTCRRLIHWTPRTTFVLGIATWTGWNGRTYMTGPRMAWSYRGSMGRDTGGRQRRCMEWIGRPEDCILEYGWGLSAGALLRRPRAVDGLSAYELNDYDVNIHASYNGHRSRDNCVTVAFVGDPSWGTASPRQPVKVCLGPCRLTSSSSDSLASVKQPGHIELFSSDLA